MSSWQPTGFSAGEFARMQQDAERRPELPGNQIEDEGRGEESANRRT